MDGEDLREWPLVEVTTEQQALEVAATTSIQADDLAVDDGLVSLDGVPEFLTKPRPVLEGVSV